MNDDNKSCSVAYWMTLSCVPFPELCFHLWQMTTDAMNSYPDMSTPTSLQFIRIFGQFCYQFFPAIYFASFDGCISLAVAEPLWAICDWSFKMVMTSSLMEANFYTTAQRREYVMHAIEQVRTSLCLQMLCCRKPWRIGKSTVLVAFSLPMLFHPTIGLNISLRHCHIESHGLPSDIL